MLFLPAPPQAGKLWRYYKADAAGAGTGKEEALIFAGCIDIIAEVYGDVSNWGRLRALPVADEASNKEWQRSKFSNDNAENFGHRNRT